MLRVFWLMCGSLALVAGIIGIVMPMVPTTPFILVAAAAFAKSSSTFSNYLLENKYFGPIIINWQENRTIPRKAIIAKIILMLISIVVSITLINR